MSGDAPRRLHPATVLTSIIRGAPSTLLGLPAILAVTSDFNLLYVIGLAIVATLVAGFVRYLAWRRFTYALTGDAVVIESGLLSRNRRTIPFDRVQDVDIEQQLLARIFGLAKVSLETGGAGKDEGALDSVSLAEAHRLRGVIRGRAAAAHHAEAAAAGEEAPAPVEGQVLFAMPFPRVLLWGLFNFSLVWLAVIFGALQYVDDFVSFDVWDWLSENGDAEAREIAAGLAVGAWVSLALLFAALGVVAGVVRTVLRDFGFTLTDEGGRFRRVRGLVTHTEAVIALKRVQLALVENGLVRRTLGWSGLKLQTLGGSGDASGRQEAAPFARDAEIDALLAPLGWARPDPAELRQVSRGHVWRALARLVGLPLVAILIGGIFLPPVLFALTLLAPLLAVAMLRRRFHRYGLPGDRLFVQRGVLTRQMWIVPVRNVQAVSIRRSWLQRRLGTASVLPDTAGAGVLSDPTVHDIRLGDAWALAGELRTRR
ncbi:PH domain-containing protein [Sphingomonas gilva]|uniref:PH domain-containing protein n=1 Tax=Sphingomonas gilva TaxID=2305907 RepID=UPI0015F86AA1|nr:PH domain-containing protein [Sphingomonas gilva]